MTVQNIHLPGINTARAGRRVLLLDEVDSTNSFLLRERQNYGDGTAAVTLAQTAGRGRGDHVWQGGGGLAMSVLFKEHGYFSPLLPIAAAVSAARAVGMLGRCTVGVKWPNDILIEGKKVCGILCESVAAGNGVTAAVCGAGFNLEQTAEFFGRPGLEHASSLLLQTGMRISVEEMAAAFLNELDSAVRRLTDDPSGLLDEYRRLCVTVGTQVKLLPSGTVGRAVRISDSGTLIVETENGTVEAYGEISVRTPDGGYV